MRLVRDAHRPQGVRRRNRGRVAAPCFTTNRTGRPCLPRRPLAVRIVLERCLQKDAKERLRDIGDARLALTGAFSPSVSSGREGGDLRSRLRPLPHPLWRRAVSSRCPCSSEVSSQGSRCAGRTPVTSPQLTRLSIGARGDAALNVTGNDQELTITPDGSRVVYVGDGGRRIFRPRVERTRGRSRSLPALCSRIRSSRPMGNGSATAKESMLSRRCPSTVALLSASRPRELGFFEARSG